MGGKGQQGCGRRTAAGGAAGPGGGPGVRGCVACRRRPRPGRLGRRARRARMRRVPAPARTQQVPGGTSTLGITHHLKDYGRAGQGPPRWRRRTWLAGASARRDMTRRHRQWARTRRGLTPSISDMPFAGNSTQQRCTRRGATEVAHLVLTNNTTLCSCVPVPPSLDLAVLAYWLS